MITPILAISLALQPTVTIETPFDAFKEFLKPTTATIVSLDIPWEPGDTVKVNAEAPPPPPPPEPEPEPEPEPQVEHTTPTPEPASRSAAPATRQNLTSTGEYSLRDLQFQGVIWWGGHKFTYYSQSVLPGPGLRIPGRHVNSSGFVSDGDGYIVLAAGYGISHGTVFSTPFGASGKVYDTCASCSPEWLDVYTQ